MELSASRFFGARVVQGILGLALLLARTNGVNPNAISDTATLTIISNTPPTISTIPSYTTFDNAPTALIPFTVGDAETAPELLSITAQSSDPALIPVVGIVVGGKAGNRTVQVTSVFNRVGVAVITLAVTDGGGLSASTSFYVVVFSRRPAGSTDDFNFDGTSDLIFEDADGYVGVWFMKHGENLLSPSPLNPGYTDPRWKIVASGDFYGEIKSHLLLQHVDGTLGIWIMNGINIVTPALLSPSHPGVGWRAVDTGDFNQDGKSDILFQHMDGSVGVWYMNGTNILSPTLLNPPHPGAGWSAVATADINRDGQEDIVFQHADSSLVVWYLQGVNRTSSESFNPAKSGVVWPVVSSTDLDGDGHADLIFQNRADTSLAVWYLNGVELIKATLLNPAKPGGTWKIVAP